ncbi:hypothetical protein ABPG74_010914 [Tetrahymena malaccensis]
MKKSLIFALVALLNIYLCQSNNSTQQICQIIHKQGVEYTSQNNNIIITGPINVNILLSLENLVIDSYITIKSNQNQNIWFEGINLRNVIFDLKNKSFIQFYGIQSFVINQFRFDNVTMSTPIFDGESCINFQFLNGFVKNSYLQQGFGNFRKIDNFVIKNKIVDINTIYNLNENFYNLYNVGNVSQHNCSFGNTQKRFLNIDPISQYKLQGEKIVKNQSYQKNYQSQTLRDLNFVKLLQDDIYVKMYTFHTFDQIKADFGNLNIRFILISGNSQAKVNFMNSQFKNMKTRGSGGCICNFSPKKLLFSNTLFDSCQSGMFGGAILSINLGILDQITIQNCKSKIGGGVFTGHNGYQQISIDRVNFVNNTATISSQQYFNCTQIYIDVKTAQCNLFEIDSIYELNTDLINTQYYQIQMELKLLDGLFFPPFTVYTSTFYQNMIYIIRLRVEYKCHEQELCSVREFDESQAIGNLYNYLEGTLQKYFYNFDIPNVNYPYLLTSFNHDYDCQPDLVKTQIFRLCFFEWDKWSLQPSNIRYGCYNLTNDCRKGMQKITNVIYQQEQCKYCDFGTFSSDPENNCEICDGMWRPQYSQYNDTYICKLNPQSLSSFKRMRTQIYRRYLSYYMKRMYIGSSFLKQNQASIYTKILLFNFQMYILTYYFVDFDKYDSSIHSRIYSFLNPFQNQGGISYDCFLKQYFSNSESLGYIKLLLSVISPLIVNGFFLITITIYSYFKKKNYFFLLISSFTYSIIFIFQSSIIQYSIESLTCIQLTSNDDYLMIDTKINCKDEFWRSQMAALGIPALIIYVFAIPIILFIYIYINRMQLENTKVIILFGFIYDEYKRKYYYWQFIKIFLTNFLSALISLGKTNIVISCYLYCSILCIYSVSIIYFKPFQQVSINNLELVSIILSILYVTSSICLQLEFSTNNQYDQNKFGKIMSETYYYIVLVCQLVFYVYIIAMIIVSVFYVSLQKLQNTRCFEKLLRIIPVGGNNGFYCICITQGYQKIIRMMFHTIVKLSTNKQRLFRQFGNQYVERKQQKIAQKNLPNQVESSKFSTGWQTTIPLRSEEANIINTVRIETKVNSFFVLLTQFLTALKIKELKKAIKLKNKISPIVQTPEKQNQKKLSKVVKQIIVRVQAVVLVEEIPYSSLH